MTSSAARVPPVTRAGLQVPAWPGRRLASRRQRAELAPPAHSLRVLAQLSCLWGQERGALPRRLPAGPSRLLEAPSSPCHRTLRLRGRSRRKPSRVAPRLPLLPPAGANSAPPACVTRSGRVLAACHARHSMGVGGRRLHHSSWARPLPRGGDRRGGPWGPAPFCRPVPPRTLPRRLGRAHAAHRRGRAAALALGRSPECTVPHTDKYLASDLFYK